MNEWLLIEIRLIKRFLCDCIEVLEFKSYYLCKSTKLNCCSKFLMSIDIAQYLRVCKWSFWRKYSNCYQMPSEKAEITIKRRKLKAKSKYVIEYSYLLSINDGVDTDVAKYSFLVTIPTIILPLLSIKIS